MNRQWQADVAAGPNALRGSGPNPSHAFEYALTQADLGAYG